MDRLWAPWRLAYLASERTGGGCPLCPEQARLVLARQKHAFVMMNRFPTNHGHVLVMPRRHLASQAELLVEERYALNDLVWETQRALEELGPHGFNVGMNVGRAAGASIEDHLHWHVVPRWHGDFNFLPVLADVKAVPELLEQTHARLLPAFAHLTEETPP